MKYKSFFKLCYYSLLLLVFTEGLYIGTIYWEKNVWQLGLHIYTVRSAYNWEPGAPCVKVFFFKRQKLLTKDSGPIWLKEPWSRRFGNLLTGRNHWKTIVNICYEAQAAWDKFFDTGHYMKKYDPSLPVEGRFYGWGLATMTGKRTQAQTTASKSGMTLTNWEV